MMSRQEKLQRISDAINRILHHGSARVPRYLVREIREVAEDDLGIHMRQRRRRGKIQLYRADLKQQAA